MKIQENVLLEDYNTFKVPVRARYFAEVRDISHLHSLLHNPITIYENRLFLGMGANILFTKDFNGIVIRSQIEHIKKVREDNDYVYYNVGSGVVWNDFVETVINEGLSGIENLIDIPGLCGSAVVQNIGAYSMELKDTIVYVRAVNMESPHQTKTFKGENCNFGYRDSIFKHEANNYFITDITFRVNKKFKPIIKYKELAEKYKNTPVSELNAKVIAKQVANIRRRKLPNYKEDYNAGSFFKNPHVDYKKNLEMIEENELVCYAVDDVYVKLSAAQLIEKAGCKGLRIGKAGVSKKHSLIICNYGDASGKEIYELALTVTAKVYEKFGILLQPEVKVL